MYIHSYTTVLDPLDGYVYRCTKCKAHTLCPQEVYGCPIPDEVPVQNPILQTGQISDGSSADYYKLPIGATELQDLISYRDMNAQMGEIFRATYRYGQAAHSNKLRDIRKILFYAQAELARLEALATNNTF